MSSQPFKLGRFQIDGKIVVGRVEGGQVAVISEEDNLAKCLRSDAGTVAALRLIPLEKAKTLAPLDPAARVFAIAVNYAAHGSEAKVAPPARPLIFYKAPSNFVEPGGKIRLNSQVTKQLDYEGEIGVVIGRPCRNASVQNALEHVVGVCAVNDGSARDLVKLKAGDSFWPDWTASKAIDDSLGVGPYIGCGEEMTDALRRKALRVTTRLNGEVVQDAGMDQMIFSVEEIIATLSSYMTLLPGDIVATGTPAGVGSARGRFLQEADALTVQVSGLDPLVMTVGE